MCSDACSLREAKVFGASRAQYQSYVHNMCEIGWMRTRLLPALLRGDRAQICCRRRKLVEVLLLLVDAVCGRVFGEVLGVGVLEINRTASIEDSRNGAWM